MAMGPNKSRWLWGPTSLDGYGAQQVSYSTTSGGPLTELKRPDHEVNHPPPLIADIKKEHVCVHCSMCLHDVKRDNLTVIIIARILFFIIYLFIYFLIYLLFICLFIYCLFLCLFIYFLFIYLFVYLYVYLFIYLFRTAYCWIIGFAYTKFVRYTWNIICPRCSGVTCRWLECSHNALRAQSRVSPAVKLLPLASRQARFGMEFSPFLMKQL
jgi:hypothetical protein